MHAPSEHTIDGKLKDLELHIVHITPGKTQLYEGLAVLGVFFDRSAGDHDNTFIE